ncbi:hypothetical protein, partial [Burkholderia sp. Se-20378]|uniref:hypothetical protein n=1 Tax=Burkholderia sp. Se-20378 TaxID=2703899 RepID=UPI001981748E
LGVSGVCWCEWGFVMEEFGSRREPHAGAQSCPTLRSSDLAGARYDAAAVRDSLARLASMAGHGDDAS